MNTGRSIEVLLQTHVTIEELNALCSSGTLTAEEERIVRAHIDVIAALQTLPREYVPVSLKQSLYQLDKDDEHSRAHKNIFRALLPFAPYAVISLFGSLLLSAGTTNTFILVSQIIFLSLLFGAVFYTLFKSKIFRI
ncbi:MAG: hypothetical protein ACOYNS_17795 [Bacteroidota bacterium]